MTRGRGGPAPRRRAERGPIARPSTARLRGALGFRQAFTPARAAAFLGVLAAGGALYGLASSPAFGYARAEIPDLRWTSRADVEAALGIPPGTNLFSLSVGASEARIEALPGVADARVEVGLPDTLVVRVTEREPILGWGVGESRFLVDRDGVLFATAEPGALAEAGIPIVADARAASTSLAIGSRLDPVDLDAATRLASLTPADIGSRAGGLLVTVNEAHGFVLGTSPTSWIAIFGSYTPSQRTTAMIPGQVRLLRSLLDGREATIAQVILADEDEGTFIPRASPAAGG